MSPGLRRALCLLALLVLHTAMLGAQGPQVRSDVGDDDDLRAELRVLDLLRDGDLADLPTDTVDPDLWAWAALDALQEDKTVRARELSEQLLAHDPDSIEGHYLVGTVHHRAEGNLPRALYHLRRARGLIEDAFGPAPSDDGPWIWHALTLGEMAMVSGEMGRHEQKLELLAVRDALYEPRSPAERGWPLMRLRRYDEARRAVEEALAMDDPDQTASALTALCAIEAEQHHRDASLEACLAAAEHERRYDLGGPTPFTNAAEASLGLLRLDQAESLLLEATENFIVGTVSNPWLDLTQLYLSQGRTPEALEAVRAMHRWRLRQPAAIDEQNRAEAEMTAAAFLLVAGRPHDALRITRRTLARPDRTGFTSSESEQMEVAAALLDSIAHRLAAERTAETIAASSWTDALRLRLVETRLRLRAWSSSRRAAAHLSAERMLLATLRPYLAGAAELPEWLEPELVASLGDGVMAAALERAEAIETVDGAEGFFAAWRVEIATHGGDARTALAQADRALDTLPGVAVLLRARVAAQGARAALRLGERGRAAELFDRALQSDPGTLRLLGLALPVRIDAAPTPVARAAARSLAASPRFDRFDASRFVVQIEGVPSSADACLLGPNGTRLACSQVTVRAGEDDAALGRRLALELQDAAFAPRLDLTQSDLESLDGSPTAAGGRGRERLHTLLDELTRDS
ncbi:MAG: hypothetical protein AAGC60_00675 [Acidobacteriota bacterium]